MLLLARLVRAVVLSLLLLLLAFAGTVFVLRYVVLPDIQNYREEIADALSEAAGQPIRFETIDANWDGPRPRLVLGRVRVHDSAGDPVLDIDAMAGTLAWQSLVRFRPLMHLLVIDGLRATVRRDRSGVLHAAGLAIEPSHEVGGFADWLLEQREVLIRGARVVWTDELRGAPTLELSGVDLSLHRHLRRHEASLSGALPADVGGPFAVQARMSGVRHSADLLRGNGRINLRLNDTSVEALRRWVDLPGQLASGRGSVELAAEVKDGAVTVVGAQIDLAHLQLVVGPELPPLDLRKLAGRVGWEVVGDGDRYSTEKLSAEMADGSRFGPLDLRLQLPLAAGGVGEMEVNALDLEVLARLAAHFPFSEAGRAQLTALAPRGVLSALAAQWQGDWARPDHFKLKTGFADLSFNPAAGRPGISGASGSLDATEQGGTLHTESRGLLLDVPGTFREPLELSSFAAQAAWQIRAGRMELKVTNLAFANEHVSGTASAVYRTADNGPGHLDLTGTAARVDVRAIARYLPLQINPEVARWLDRAVISGTGDSVQVRLKGDLGRFPFRKDEDGLFEVSARVSDGVLDYAEGWPRIEGLGADLLFRGVRMEVNARRGGILGAQLGKVKAVIADLDDTDRQRLAVTGEVRGPASEFLRFIAASPVDEKIDHFTDGMSARGEGLLRLRLDIPLHDTDATRVAGQYQFIDNDIILTLGLWPLEKLNGVFSFTENGVEAQGVRGQFVGGPFVMQFSSRPGGRVGVSAQGSATAAGLALGIPGPMAARLRGAANWQARFDIDHKSLAYQVESDLVGMEVDLPPPMGKPAGLTRPLRIGPAMVDASRRLLTLNYGDVLSAKLEMSLRPGAAVIERGTVALGREAPPPERDGIWVSGSLPELSVDRWRPVLGGGGTAYELPLAGIDLQLGRLELLGRSVHELNLKATRQANSWQARVDSREVVGDLTWSGTGRGTLTARLDRLILLEAGEPLAVEGAPAELQLPTLDFQVEHFQSRDVVLGRLELQAAQAGTDWRIDRATITNEDASLSATGAWRGWLARPETALDMKLDIIDSGRLLTRFGYPEAMTGGAGSIEGRLSWAGGPASLDYGSLGGNFRLGVGKGQFRQVKPGLGKLLGIISLQSLARRFSLDFRDVFSEGFAFDSIDGSVRINRGVMHTDDFRMAGPSAQVAMKGDVNIVQQTQALTMRVQPTVAESVSVAGAFLGGPLVGIGALVLQKLFKDPIEQLVSFEYQVEGTWSEPKVSKKQSAGGAAQP